MPRNGRSADGPATEPRGPLEIRGPTLTGGLLGYVVGLWPGSTRLDRLRRSAGSSGTLLMICPLPDDPLHSPVCHSREEHCARSCPRSTHFQPALTAGLHLRGGYRPGDRGRPDSPVVPDHQSGERSAGTAAGGDPDAGRHAGAGSRGTAAAHAPDGYHSHMGGLRRAPELLGWEPVTPLEVGLRAAVDWYIKQEDWARKVRLA